MLVLKRGVSFPMQWNQNTEAHSLGDICIGSYSHSHWIKYAKEGDVPDKTTGIF